MQSCALYYFKMVTLRSYFNLRSTSARVVVASIIKAFYERALQIVAVT